MAHALGNDHLHLAVDGHGCLLSLRNLTTGWEYIAQPGLDFWRIIYAHDEDPEMIVAAAQQPEARITTGPRGLEVHYPFLVDVHGRRVEASLTWRAQVQEEEIAFTAELENRGLAVLGELWFPMIGGVRGPDDDPARSFLLYPESAGRRIFDPVRHVADRNAQPVRGARFNCIRDFYPGRASMQWMGLYGNRGSLYIGSHDKSLQTTATNVLLNVAPRSEDDSLSMGFIKYPFLSAGGRWKSEPFIVSVHGESWRHDAQRYRRFVEIWQDHRRPRPKWVQDMPALHDVVMLHQHGRVNYRYEQIADICRAAETGGIRCIKLTGWSEGGHDNMYPDFHASERLGGEEAMVRAFRQAKDGGFRIVQYFHFVQMSPNSEFYRRHGEFCAIKGRYGHPFIDIFTWPSGGSVLAMNERFQLINACVNTEPWRQQVLECVRRGLDWGADCIFLDQTAGAPSSFLCFDSRHEHDGPAYACGPGKVRLSQLAREMVKGHNPEVALGAEYICDAILQYYDFTIQFGMGALHGEQHFGDMYRYTFPEDILCSQYISREDYRQLHYSFLMGYRFFLAPRQQCELLTALDERFVQRLAQLVRLREKHTALMRGTFRETEPLEITEPRLLAPGV